FFVISGFLITTHLLQSLEREGRIRFGRFYAKRARRILPAALLVAGLTVVAAWLWMSPLLLRKVVVGAIATALYVPNYFFAAEDTNYLAETTPSDRKSTRLNSSHVSISYAVVCLKKK